MKRRVIDPSPLACLACLACLPLFAMACAEAPKATLVEDQSRRVAPLPACVMYLPARRPETAGTGRKLREEQVLKLLLPDFVEETRTLPKPSAACNGRAVFDDPSLAGGVPLRGAWPLVEQDGDVLYGSGGDRSKIVWAHLLRFDDGTVGGPIAIVRAGERFAEAFAAGTYRAHADRVRLGTQRLGGEMLVTAQEEACIGRKPGDGCEDRLTIFLPRAGVLGVAAEIPTERVAYGQGEHGTTGPLEYRLTTSADYRPDGVRVTEQIRVTDDGGRELRRAEVERLFSLDDVHGTLSAAESSLWERVVGPDRPAAQRGTPLPPRKN